MTCQDFQQKWNELLDSETGGATDADTSGAPSPAGDAEALLLAHAADCPACRPIALRYQTLRHAIRSWRRPPAPPADLAERILAARAEPMAATAGTVSRRARSHWPTRARSFRIVAGLAAAVLVAVGLRLAIPRLAREPGLDRRGPAPQVIADGRDSIPDRENTPPILNRALAEATSATWDLARSASQPAARIGRDVLDATVRPRDDAADGPDRPTAAARPEPDDGLASLRVSVPSLSALGPDGAGASGVLQQVGDQFSAGVQPLSRTARHAFGFLLGPPAAPADARPGASTSTGARSG